MIELHRVSEEALCMDSLDVEKLRRKDVEREVYKVRDKLTGETFERPLMPVRLGSFRYWADAVTGTLYSVKGVCQSSARLHVVGLR